MSDQIHALRARGAAIEDAQRRRRAAHRLAALAGPALVEELDPDGATRLEAA